MKRFTPSRQSILFCITLCILMLIGLGCTVLHEKGQIPKCKAFFGLVREYWQRNPTNGLFPMKLGSDKGLDQSIVECGECLESLPRKEFERLFGKADTTLGNHLAYYLTEPCNSTIGPNADGCYYLDCILDATGKVKGVTIAMDQFIADPKGGD